MASENVYLLTFAIVLFAVNAFLGGPMAAGIAAFFSRISSQRETDVPESVQPKYGDSVSNERTPDPQSAERGVASRHAA